MIIKLDDKFNEWFPDEETLDYHYDKHVIRRKEFGDLSKSRYDMDSDNLSRLDVGGDIDGFIGRYFDKLYHYKYNYKTNALVIYKLDNRGEHITISYFKRNRDSYERHKKEDYVSEIPKGE